jgi:hypothetical protein
LRDRDVHDHPAHERVAGTDQKPANKQELQKILRLTEQQKTCARNETAHGHKQSSSVPIY